MSWNTRDYCGARLADILQVFKATGDGIFTPALFRPANTTMYIRYTNTQGNADNEYIPVPTQAAWLPVSGKLK